MSQKQQQQQQPAFTLRQLFVHACEKGDLKTAQQLYIQLMNASLQMDVRNVFRCVCKLGHLRVAKWLVSIEPMLSNPNMAFYDTFCVVCQTRHLHVAKWLLTINPAIVVLDFLDAAFHCACATSNGHLRVAKWLLTIKPTTITTSQAWIRSYIAEKYLHNNKTTYNYPAGKWLRRLVRE